MNKRIKKKKFDRKVRKIMCSNKIFCSLGVAKSLVKQFDSYRLKTYKPTNIDSWNGIKIHFDKGVENDEISIKWINPEGSDLFRQIKSHERFGNMTPEQRNELLNGKWVKPHSPDQCKTQPSGD